MSSRDSCFGSTGASRAAPTVVLAPRERPAQSRQLFWLHGTLPRSPDSCFYSTGRSRAAPQIIPSAAGGGLFVQAREFALKGHESRNIVGVFPGVGVKVFSSPLPYIYMCVCVAPAAVLLMGRMVYLPEGLRYTLPYYKKSGHWVSCPLFLYQWRAP
jgi:hypothetical protein